MAGRRLVMVFYNGCEPSVDWSLCVQHGGYPQVLPPFYLVLTVLYAFLGLLYSVSVALTARAQLKEKKKTSFNTAMQMHAGVVTYSTAGFVHALCLVSQEPLLPSLPLLLLYHVRFIGSAYVSVVLMRHWAIQYEQMTLVSAKGCPENGCRFKGFRGATTVLGILMCIVLFGTVVCGSAKLEEWETIVRLQHFLWALFCAGTSVLVIFLGKSVHAKMRVFARSGFVLGYLRRVKYVVRGGFILWCQGSGCFLLSSLLERPLSPRTWLILHCGMNLTTIGTGFLYYIVVGSKAAERVAALAAAEVGRVEGVKQVQVKLQAVARMVSSGANHFMGGMGTIASVGETSARVHLCSESEEPRSFRLKSGQRWPMRGKLGRNEPAKGFSMKSNEKRNEPKYSGVFGKDGCGAKSREREPPSATKDGVDEEVGLFHAVSLEGGAQEVGSEEKKEGNSGVPEAQCSSMGHNDANGDQEISGELDQNQHLEGGVEQRKRSSLSRDWLSSRHDSYTPCSRRSGKFPREKQDSSRTEDFEMESTQSSHHHDCSDSGEHPGGLQESLRPEDFEAESTGSSQHSNIYHRDEPPGERCDDVRNGNVKMEPMNSSHHHTGSHKDKPLTEDKMMGIEDDEMKSTRSSHQHCGSDSGESPREPDKALKIEHYGTESTRSSPYSCSNDSGYEEGRSQSDREDPPVEIHDDSTEHEEGEEEHRHERWESGSRSYHSERSFSHSSETFVSHKYERPLSHDSRRSASKHSVRSESHDSERLESYPSEGSLSFDSERFVSHSSERFVSDSSERSVSHSIEGSVFHSSERSLSQSSERSVSHSYDISVSHSSERSESSGAQRPVSRSSEGCP